MTEFVLFLKRTALISVIERSSFSWCYDFQDRQIVNGRCGGHCGRCSPNDGFLKLELLPWRVRDVFKSEFIRKFLMRVSHLEEQEVSQYY